MNTKFLTLLSASLLALSACSNDAPPVPADGPEVTAAVDSNADSMASAPDLEPLDPLIAAEAAEAQASVPQAAAVADAVLNDAAIEKAIQDQERMAEEQADEDTVPR